MSITVLLADDHLIMRQGLRGLLEKIPQVEVVGEADNGAEAVKLAQRLQPNLSILDVTMPGLNGLEATRRIRHDCPQTRVIALSMRTERHFVMGMLKAGASAYLLKDCSFDELVTAIKKVHGGGTYLPPAVADIVVDDLHVPAGESASSLTEMLTSREREILQLIAEARKSKEIADELHISVKTVYTHRRNIMEKLGARNLADLTRIAIREGLTTPGR
ncbi:MAG: response regulator transcription factor [Deltaproteobacteria bacterium]|nr:response regulator transcription factor [Deltaproteobacteria bacterium]